MLLLKSSKLNHIIWIILLSAFSLIMLTPLFMMFFTSFKTMDEIRSPIFSILPQKFTFDNYFKAFAAGEWNIYFMNSIIITLCAVVFSVLFNSIAGYAFARLKFRGSKILFLLLLVGLMMPPQVTLLPTFLIMKTFPFAGGNNIFGQGGFGLINSYLGLIIPSVSGSFGVFLCKQYYTNFPKSLDEAAEIDGASKWRAYFQIYLPNSKTILATLALLKGVTVWNDYMWPLVMTNSEKMKTVQLALTMFKTDGNIQWNLMMSGATLVVLPMIVLFLTCQKYFIQGAVTSGLK